MLGDVHRGGADHRSALARRAPRRAGAGPRPAAGRARPGRRPPRPARRCAPTARACRRSAWSAPAAAARRGPATSAGAPPAPRGSPSSTTTSCPIPTGTSGSTPTCATCPPTSPAARAGSACRCPRDRRPTDWERGTAGLATSSWITADLAYRRAALAAVGGFDERFPARVPGGLRPRAAGDGHRRPAGPGRSAGSPTRCGPADRWVSLRVQAGNADDVLMRRLHGPRWRERADAPLGRRPRHLAVTAAGLAARRAGRGPPSPRRGARRCRLAGRHRRVRVGPDRARARGTAPR